VPQHRVGRPGQVGLQVGVAQVVQLDDMVVVGGTTPPLPKDTACAADYASRPARLHLAQPLGTRPVIDIASGRPRVLGVPAF